MYIYGFLTFSFKSPHVVQLELINKEMFDHPHLMRFMCPFLEAHKSPWLCVLSLIKRHGEAMFLGNLNGSSYNTKMILIQELWINWVYWWVS